jgi:hypothetical protein
MEYILDAAGVVADGLLIWWIVAGPSFKKTTRENDAAIDSSRG